MYAIKCGVTARIYAIGNYSSDHRGASWHHALIVCRRSKNLVFNGMNVLDTTYV